MKPLRVLLIGAGVIVVLLLVVVALALNSGVQTWAARRALAAQPDLQGEIGRVSVGLREVHGENIVIRRPGMLLTLPSIDAELGVIGVLREKLAVERLVARGWTLDLTAPEFAHTAAPVTRSQASLLPLPVAAAAGAAETIVPVADLLAALELPVELHRLDGVELEGRVIFPTVDGPATAEVRIVGGGLSTSSAGEFHVDATTAMSADSTSVSRLELDTTLSARMRTPRTFAQISASSLVAAQGGVLSEPVQLRIELQAGAANGAPSEYRLELYRGDKSLLQVNAHPLPDNAAQLAGEWKMSMTAADIAPFALGFPLPEFQLSGEGSLGISAADGGTDLAGKLQLRADQLEAMRPELAAVGLVNAAVSFDARRIGNDVRVTRLEADVSGAQPVLSLRTKQGLEFNLSTGELKVADPESDLLDLQLHGLPLEWLQPFLGAFAISGSPAQGSWTAGARDGGFVLRAVSPLRTGGVRVSEEGNLLAGPVDVALSLSGEYLPGGWQARVENGHVRSGTNRLIAFDARAGQAAATGAAIVATSRFNADLGAILAQPAGAPYRFLRSGVTVGEFIVAVSEKIELAAELEVANLTSADGAALPQVGLELRADVAEDGRVEAHAPLHVTKDGRASDVTVDAQLRPTEDALHVDALASGRHVFVQDLQMLLLPLLARQESAEAAAETGTGGTPVPIWNGLEGKLRMSFGTVVYSEALTVTNVEGEVALRPEQLSVPQLQATLTTGGQFRFQGALGFEEKQPEPYVLQGTVAATEVKVGELMTALSPGSTPPVEGVFDLTSTLHGRAASVDQLADQTAAEAKLSSRGGVLRALSVTVADYAKTASTLANVAGFIGSLTGDSRAQRIKAAADLANQLANLNFDQLNIEITRSPGNQIAIEDLSLISPAIRLLGSGTVGDAPGRPLWEEPLNVTLQLSAREAVAENLRALRLLKDSADTLGYLPMVEEITLQGSLGNITRSQLQSLISRALSQ